MKENSTVATRGGQHRAAPGELAIAQPRMTLPLSRRAETALRSTSQEASGPGPQIGRLITHHTIGFYHCSG